MATFTPPTHTEYITPPGVDRLWSRVPYQRGDAVLIEGDTVTVLTVVDSDRLQAADYGYLGGATYTDVPPDAELLLLGDSAPIVGLTDESWPAWLP